MARTPGQPEYRRNILPVLRDSFQSVRRPCLPGQHRVPETCGLVGLRGSTSQRNCALSRLLVSGACAGFLGGEPAGYRIIYYSRLIIFLVITPFMLHHDVIWIPKIKKFKISKARAFNGQVEQVSPGFAGGYLLFQRYTRVLGRKLPRFVGRSHKTFKNSPFNRLSVIYVRPYAPMYQTFHNDLLRPFCQGLLLLSMILTHNHPLGKYTSLRLIAWCETVSIQLITI
jgi:hypothetical protein